MSRGCSAPLESFEFMVVKKPVTVILAFVVLAIFVFGFVRIWPHANIFGVQKINTYEFLSGCWEGDVRVCDYDPFE